MQPSPENIYVGLLVPAYYLRVGLHSVLEQIPGMGVTFNGASLAELEGRPRFDVLVCAGLPPQSADLARFLRDADPGIGVLLLLEAPPDPQLLERLRSRPWSVLSLEAGPEELSAALHALTAGLWSGDPALLGGILPRPPELAPDGESMESLTARELEVLKLLARGMANKQIASALNLSENTVKFHISTIYAKLGAGNRAEAVMLGARRGLIGL